MTTHNKTSKNVQAGNWSFQSVEKEQAMATLLKAKEQEKQKVINTVKENISQGMSRDYAILTTARLFQIEITQIEKFLKTK